MQFDLKGAGKGDSMSRLSTASQQPVDRKRKLWSGYVILSRRGKLFVGSFSFVAVDKELMLRSLRTQEPGIQKMLNEGWKILRINANAIIDRHISAAYHGDKDMGPVMGAPPSAN